MRGHWWGIAALGAAVCLSIFVAAAKTPPKSSPESVTIPLILQQPSSEKPEKVAAPKPTPKTDEPKSPQAILEESTPVAMQSPAQLAEPAPELPPPQAPTLGPALPTNPELFVPDLTLPPVDLRSAPKPAPAKSAPPPVPAKPVALPAPLPVAPKPELSSQPVVTPMPKAKPVRPDPGKMKPVEEFAPGTLRVGNDGKPPSFRCFVRDVMAFYDRTHVRCYNKVQGKVNFFAVDTNQPIAATVLTKALAAMQSGQPLTIAFAPETDLNPSNCGKKDCRRIIDIEN